MTNNEIHNEKELVKRLLTGDQGAMKEVFRTYYLRLLYFTMKAVGNKPAAEDLVQEALLNFWINVSEKQVSPENIQRYLFQMVRNRSINYLKKQHREDENNGAVLERFYSETDQQVNEAQVREELYQRIVNSFEHLTTIQAVVMKHIYLDGLSVQQIADQLSTTPNNVRNHKARAIERLRQVLDTDLFLSFFLFLKIFSKFL